MEQLYSHNPCQNGNHRCHSAVPGPADAAQAFSWRTHALTVPAVNLSTEPDASFVSYDRLDNGQVREVPGSRGGVVELEGTPDMVLEIVSESGQVKEVPGRQHGVVELEGTPDMVLEIVMVPRRSQRTPNACRNSFVRLASPGVLGELTSAATWCVSRSCT